jgi:hypothetical protein
MGRIDVILEDELEKKFRNEVFRRYGMKKGNITEALHEAVNLWLTQEKVKRSASRASATDTLPSQ